MKNFRFPILNNKPKLFKQGQNYIVAIEKMRICSFLLIFLEIWKVHHHVMLTHHEWLYQVDSNVLAYSWIISSRELLLRMVEVLIFLKPFMRLKMKFFSSSLFFIMVCLLSWMNSSAIEILTIRRAWSNKYCKSERMEWFWWSLVEERRDW